MNEINAPQKIRTALRNAQKAAQNSSFKFRVGAVIFKNNNIISVGHNQNKSHPLARKFFQYGTVHAEINAITSCQCLEKIKKADILVSRQTKNGRPANAKPCPLCVLVMALHSIRRVYWTTKEFPYWDWSEVSELIKNIDEKKVFKFNTI